jgi:polygalacturonase
MDTGSRQIQAQLEPQVNNPSSHLSNERNSPGTNTFENVSNVVYKNITISDITGYGIDVQQDYLNGEPRGDPTNDVILSGISFIDVKGTVESSADDFYILSGPGSFSDFTCNGNAITGGSTSCNYATIGYPQTG